MQLADVRSFLSMLRLEYFSNADRWAQVMAEAERLRARYGDDACEHVRGVIARLDHVDPEQCETLRLVEQELRSRRAC